VKGDQPPGRRGHEGLQGVSKDTKIWIGVDPGGKANFGLSIFKADGSCHTCTVDYVDAAVETILKHVDSIPVGIGVDAPLWWSSGSGGLRKADQWIRDQYGLHHRNVQAVNSLWGSVLAQGMMFVTRIREAFPGVNVTETHPKAVLVALGRESWKEQLSAIPTILTLDSKPDHERDALISGIAAREGFEGRWKRDLIEDRYPCEQNPSTHWLAPVHYFWPA
jgi:predicted nuclease with RNAse H fold